MFLYQEEALLEKLDFEQTFIVPEHLTLLTILAKESADFSARIAVLGHGGRFNTVFRNPHTKKQHFFCKDSQTMQIFLFL